MKYDNNSIRALKGADRVRKKPSVIFGSDGIEGCTHSIFEIISNSLDEARAGFGSQIIITRFLDNSFKVEDFGRGMPVDYNEKEQCFNWELLFCEMYAGGKYGANEYKFSLGLNGLGLCATQYASEWMIADIFRDKKHYHLDFKKGENVGGLSTENYKTKRTGSIIHWKPDLEVFTDINIQKDTLIDMLKRQAVANPKVKIELKWEIEENSFENYEYCYKRGIVEYIENFTDNNNLTEIQYIESETRGKDREDKDEYQVKMTAAFCFSNQSQLLEYYHNSSWLEYGGAPEKAVKSAFTSQIDSYIKTKGLYKKGESKISFSDIQDCLVFVSNCFSTETSYENQTKKAITNTFIATAMTDFLKLNLETYFIENPDEATKIVNQILINKRSRENAEKTRQSIKKTMTSQMDITNKVQKFVDCRTKDLDRRELFIVEGDSALGACKQSRDSEFQALMPIRGKILNCLKVDFSRIFKSDIITDLVKIMGCGVEVQNKHHSQLSNFDINNLRWNKIIIATDADVDGFQIRTLVITMIYRLMPTLIKEGFVYIVETPLYEINSKDKVYFAYNEQEKNDALKKIGNNKYTIQRSKGLGENDSDMMWLTTMSPETRRLIRVLPDEAKEMADMFDLLLGDNLQGRKTYIEEHGNEYLEDIDIS